MKATAQRAKREIAKATEWPGVSLNLKEILVPIDFSECSKKALRYAVPLAQQFGATLTLLECHKSVRRKRVARTGTDATRFESAPRLRANANLNLKGANYE